MKEIINAAIQVVPQGSTTQEIYDKVDRLIRIIESSGLVYEVTPFETAVEGTWDEILSLFKELNLEAQKDSDDVLAYLKVQSRKGGVVRSEEKVKKYAKK